MQIPQLGIGKNRKTIVVLGAGASRGASFFLSRPYAAPLDSDFFVQMQKVSHRSPLLQEFLMFLRDEFGSGQLPKMEELFTQLEALDRFYAKIGRRAGPRIRRYRKALDDFTAVMATFFGILFDDKNGRHPECKAHVQLAKALNAGDSVISFNYDCLMDYCLKRHARNSWNARIGYGVEVKGFDAWNSEIGAGRRAVDSIRLLKMHGSLNWHRPSKNGEIKLRGVPYATTKRRRGEIVPPVWNKTIDGDAALTAIWKEARSRLSMGTVMIVVGYSVPQTDLLTQALIRTTSWDRTKLQKLSHLILVNPSAEDRARFVNLVRPALTEETTVVELDRLTQFTRLLKPEKPQRRKPEGSDQASVHLAKPATIGIGPQVVASEAKEIG